MSLQSPRKHLPAAIVAAVFVGSAFSASTAFALNSNYGRDQPTGPILIKTATIPANTAATFETTNLRTTARSLGTPDTVLHVLDSSSNAQIAANDDCAGTYRSCVTLTASSVTRNVRILVRAYSNNSFGLATYRQTIGAAVAQEDTYFGGTIRNTGVALGTGAWIETVEQNRGFGSPFLWDGANNTVLLVLDGGSTSLKAYDDESGVVSMSKLRTNFACSASCQIVSGDSHYSGSTSGYELTKGVFTVTSLLYSDDPLDSDGDGLPNHFESLSNVATQPSLADTDADGLPDGVEVIGLDNQLLRYPFFGANPKITDVFVEIDYANGAAWSAANAENYVRAFRFNGWKKSNGVLLPIGAITPHASDIRVHVDTGTNNPNLDETRFVWGNWGGSSGGVASADCAGFSPIRNSNLHWHHQVSGSAAQAGFGRCGRGDFSLSRGSHELGHQLGLEHGGLPAWSGSQGNILYPSIMSYQYGHVDEAPAFSAKGWLDKLNPALVSETDWGYRNTTDRSAYIKASFTAARFVSGRNHIDFNGDNVFSTTPQRGAGLYGRETAIANRNDFHTNGANMDAEMTWLPGSPKRLYVFHLVSSSVTGKSFIEYRYTTDTANCDLKQTNLKATCNTFTGYNYLAATMGAKRFMGVERVQVNGAWRILVVFVAANDELRYLVMDQNGFHPPVLQVGAGYDVTTGPALVRLSNTRVLLFAGVGSARLLHSWLFDSNVSTWISNRVSQVYGDGSPVYVSQAGLGITRGYLADTGSTIQYVGALVDPASGLVKMARYDSALQRWNPLTGLNASARGGQGFPSDGAKLQLAYAPYTTASLTAGRFHLAYTRLAARAPNGTGYTDIYLVKTIGNDPNAAVDAATGLRPRVLQWRQGGAEELAWTEYDGTTPGAGFKLLYDVEYDTRLRMTNMNRDWNDTTIGKRNTIIFLPQADGHINFDLNDFDDWIVMRRNLVCALKGCPRQ